MNHPEKTEDNIVSIDGDKVVAFVKGVGQLHKILEQINIIGIADAFVKGARVESIDEIIRLSEKWMVSMAHVREGLEEQGARINSIRQSTMEMVGMMDHAIKSLGSPKFKEGLVNLKEFSDLLNNIAKHKESGLIELVCKLSNHDHA